MRSGARMWGAAAGIVLFTLVSPVTEAVGKEIEYRGKSSQDRRVLLWTQPSGEFKFFSLKWRLNCESGRSRSASTGFAPPLDQVDRDSFRDAGRYAVRSKRRKYVFNVGVRGNQVSQRRWEGSFRGSIDVFDRGGGRVDRCSVERLRWLVKR